MPRGKLAAVGRAAMRVNDYQALSGTAEGASLHARRPSGRSFRRKGRYPAGRRMPGVLSAGHAWKRPRRAALPEFPEPSKPLTEMTAAERACTPPSLRRTLRDDEVRRGRRAPRSMREVEIWERAGRHKTSRQLRGSPGRNAGSNSPKPSRRGHRPMDEPQPRPDASALGDGTNRAPQAPRCKLAPESPGLRCGSWPFALRSRGDAPDAGTYEDAAVLGAGSLSQDSHLLELREGVVGGVVGDPVTFGRT